MKGNLMKNKLLILLMLVPLFTFAQNETFKGEHFIEVNGIAKMEVEPNEIFTILRLKEFEENRNKVPLEKLDKDFMNALKEAGIDRKRLELADAGSQLGNVTKRDKETFRQKTYQLKLTSAAELEKVLAAIQPVNVDYFDITKLSHTDIEKLKIDIKIQALKAAKAKAEYLLKSIGAEVGKPLMIRDWEMEPEQPVYRMTNVEMKAQSQQGDVAEEPQIGFRKIKLQAQVVAQFEIK
jgi:uncharacterized protein YggE